MVSVMHDLDPAMTPRELLADLPEQARSLVHVVAEVYAGNWTDLIEDLRRRQAGQPYLFRLQLEPGTALAWATRFQAYESARGDRLVDALAAEDER